MIIYYLFDCIKRRVTFGFALFFSTQSVSSTIVSEMTYGLLCVAWNSTHSLTHSLPQQQV